MQRSQFILSDFLFSSNPQNLLTLIRQPFHQHIYHLFIYLPQFSMDDCPPGKTKPSFWAQNLVSYSTQEHCPTIVHFFSLQLEDFFLLTTPFLTTCEQDAIGPIIKKNTLDLIPCQTTHVPALYYSKRIHENDSTSSMSSLPSLSWATSLLNNSTGKATSDLYLAICHYLFSIFILPYQHLTCFVLHSLIFFL